MTTTPDRTISITDTEAISHLDLTIPRGGVLLLKGRNGCGKSTALRAVGAVLGSGDKLAKSDLSAAKGRVEGLGVSITLGKVMRRTGPAELQVATLDSRADPSVVVDPGIKDPAAADERRIQALLALTAEEARPADFAALVGGEERLAELVDLEALAEISDPVELAKAIRRALHAQAKRAEDRRKDLDGQITASRRDLDGVELDAPHDESALDEALEKAQVALARGEEAASGADAARASAEQARSRLADLGDPPDLQALEAALESAHGAERKAATLVASLRQQLAAAEMERGELEMARERAEGALSAGQQRVASRETAEEAIALAEGKAGPSAADLAELRAGRDAARAAVETGRAVRQARAKAERVEGLKADRRAADQEAARLREAAQGTDRVLGDLVALAGVAGLSVRDGRLVTQTQRGETYFAELSHGERYRTVMPAAIAAVGRGGLITMAQEGWEALDPENRAYVRQAALEAEVTLLAAVASDGDLRAEVFES